MAIILRHLQRFPGPDAAGAAAHWHSGARVREAAVPLFLGVGLFVLGALGHMREAPAGHADDWRSKIGFWLMFLGFNLAFFPTTLRRSQAVLTNPTQLLFASAGPEVVLGAVMLVAASASGVTCWSRAAYGVDRTIAAGRCRRRS